MLLKRSDARAKLIERFLRSRGPVTLRDVLSHYGLPGKQVTSALTQLQDADLVVEGQFLPDQPTPQYCWKANLEELHRKSLARLKKEIEPVAVEQYVDFVLRWQYVHPETRLRGTDGLREVLRRTQLHEDLIRLWERDILPARVVDYSPEMLDELIEATGAQAVQYATKLECCGGGLLAVDEDVALEMPLAKLQELVDAGADAMVLVCPFCDIMYEYNQRRVARAAQARFQLPVLFYPQVLGLALGIPADELGFRLNRVKSRGLMAKLAALEAS